MRQVTLRAGRAGTPDLACPRGRMLEHRRPCGESGRAAGRCGARDGRTGVFRVERERESGVG